MVCVVSVGIWNCDAFCQACLNSADAPHFHGKRRRNPCFTRRHGHQSAAVLVGGKWHTYRHVFKCCCGVFFAFLLTRTVCNTGAWVVGGALVHKKVNRVGERGRVELGSGRSCGA